MCSRFFADDTTEMTVREMTGDPDHRVLSGDIRPSAPATILAGRDDEALAAEEMTWGFPGYEGIGILINARAETVTQRSAFRDNVKARRCVIPARSFYEWTPEKNRYQFEEPGMTLFMAGIFDPQRHFVIITTAANESVRPVHDRMPLLLSEEETRRWVLDPDCMSSILRKVPQALQRWTEYEQMTLFE